MSRQITTFAVGEMLLGLDILIIKEVHRQVAVTPVPGAPEAISGLMNLRGRVVTVIDPEVCLNLPRTHGAEKRLLVLKTDGEISDYIAGGMLGDVVLGGDIVGLLIDRMEEVQVIENEDVLPPPPNLDTTERKIIEGVIKLKNRLIVLLNVTRMLEGVLTASSISGESTCAGTPG